MCPILRFCTCHTWINLGVPRKVVFWVNFSVIKGCRLSQISRNRGVLFWHPNSLMGYQFGASAVHPHTYLKVVTPHPSPTPAYVGCHLFSELFSSAVLHLGTTVVHAPRKSAKQFIFWPDGPIWPTLHYMADTGQAEFRPQYRCTDRLLSHSVKRPKRFDTLLGNLFAWLQHLTDAIVQS